MSGGISNRSRKQKRKKIIKKLFPIHANRLRVDNLQKVFRVNNVFYEKDFSYYSF